MRVKGRQRKVRSYVEYWPVGLGLGLGLASLDRRGIGWIWLRPAGKVSPSPWCCNQRFLAFPICRNAAEKLGRAGVVHPAWLLPWRARGPGDAATFSPIPQSEFSREPRNRHGGHAVGGAPLAKSRPRM